MRWLREVFQRHIVQDVPNDLAACEFDCKVTECTYGDWKHCKIRIPYTTRPYDRISRSDYRLTPVLSRVSTRVSKKYAA